MKKTAKILALVLALVLLVSLAACGASDSGNGASDGASALVGTWESKEAPGTFYEFNADGTGTLKGEGYTMNLTYVDKGASVDITYEGSDSVQNNEYTVDGSTLTLAGITYTKK